MASIFRLSNEILKEILDHIDTDPQKSIPVDRREYLSVESFRPPSPPAPSQTQDIGHLRLSCRRFSQLAIPYQFTRVTLRFSSRGFRRLAEICSHDHLAKHTKKFSYLVPLFYGESKSFTVTPETLSNTFCKIAYMWATLCDLLDPHTIPMPVTISTFQTPRNFVQRNKIKRKFYDQRKICVS